MPRKPRQACAYPSCPRLVHGRYCDEHSKVVARHYEKYTRNPSIKRKYGSQWKRVRDRYVQTHPLCEKCLKDGKIVPVDEVHHRIPVSRGGSHEPSNLVSLCRSCHNKIHHKLGDR